METIATLDPVGLSSLLESLAQGARLSIAADDEIGQDPGLVERTNSALVRLQTAALALNAIESAGRTDLVRNPGVICAAIFAGPAETALEIARESGYRQGLRAALEGQVASAYSAGFAAAREQGAVQITVKMPKDSIRLAVDANVKLPDRPPRSATITDKDGGTSVIEIQ